VLFLFDNALTDQPVRSCHNRVDRAGGGTPGVFKNDRYVGKQVVVASKCHSFARRRATCVGVSHFV
jgi:hypothetical protein